MGHLVKKDDHFEYQQEDGRPTAWFSDIVEKTELSHRGSPAYKRIFYVLIGLGALYLGLVFAYVH